MSDYPYASFVSRTPLPISTGEVLEKLWRTLRGSWKLYLGLGAPLAVVGTAWMVLTFAALFAAGALPPRPGVQPDLMRVIPLLFGASLIGMIPNLVIYALYQAATAFTALKEASGQKTTVREAYAVAWGRAGHYCWLIFLHYLCVALPALLCGGIFAGVMLALQAAHQSDSPVMLLAIPLFFLAYLGAMVYAIWMMLRLGMAFPASVAESLTAVEALKRSAKLSCKVKGKLFLVLLVVYAISYAAIFVLEIGGGLVFAVGALLFAALHLSETAGIAAGVVAGLAFVVLIFAYTALIWAAYTISFTIVYCDQRLRLDGSASEPGPAAGGSVPA